MRRQWCRRVIASTCLLAGMTGCSSFKYTAGAADFELRNSETPRASRSFTGSMTTHTVTAMDTTGTVCASIANFGEESTALYDALDEASPYQDTVTYSYRVHTAEEYGAGIRCGGYFRHGAGSRTFGYEPGRDLAFAAGEYEAESVSSNEAGLIIDLPNRFGDGLYLSPMIVVGVGFVDIVSSDPDVPTRSENFGEFDFGARVDYLPGYLYGFGVHGKALLNLANFSFNLGASAGYTLALSEAFVIEAGVGFDHRDVAWPADGGYEMRTNEINAFGRVSLLW